MNNVSKFQLGDNVLVRGVIEEIKLTNKGLKYCINIGNDVISTWVTVKEEQIEKDVKK